MRQNDLTVAIFSGVAVVISILFPLVLRWRDEWHKRRLTAAETLRNEQDKVAIDTKHAAALLSGFVERYPAIQEHLSFLGAFKGIHPEGQLWEALQLTPATVPASASVIERLAAKQLAGADLTTWLRLDAARASAREFWESFYGAIHDNTLPVGFDRETPEADVDLLDHRPARDMNLWRLRAESFRALIEPLDIANFYRLRKSDAAPHYISSRPAIYTYLRQIKWYHEFQQHRMDGTRAREEPAFEESMAWAYAKDATLRPLEMSGAILASNRLDVHGSKEFGGWPNLTATAHLKNGNPYDHTTM